MSINKKEHSNTINNVLANFIYHDTIRCYYKNLPWFNNKVENLIKKKNSLYKFYHTSVNPLNSVETPTSKCY